MDLGTGTLAAGRAGRVELRVTAADTAEALGSGDVPVLGTPRVLALAEEATVAATAGTLPDGATTVGTRVELAHLIATPVGATVVAEAVLSTVDGRRLEFAVTVHHGATVVARGRVERAVVDRSRFLARVGTR
ncbi:MAG TPA: thioesterase [Rugosimonospora sp.]|nr:thioesterase [Rugosimonospora sp.]